MPIYEYRCSACTRVSEELRRIADRDNPAVCKVCGAPACHVLSSFSVSSNCPPSQTKNEEQAPDDGRVLIQDCTFKNAKVGVSMPKGTKIEMKGNRFINVKKSVEFRDEQE